MANWRYHSLSSSFLAFLLGSASYIQTADAQSAGTVGAVNAGVKSRSLVGGTREVRVGQTVMQNEQFTTNANGTVHIIFNDRAALNIGRNSSVTVEKFVYNKSAGTGEMVISMQHSTARLVGGQVSHSSGATVKTPVATIGVRGGNITFSHHEGVTTVMMHSGVATVTTNAGTIQVRAGQQVMVTGTGPLATAGPIDMNQLRALTRELTSQLSQSGGTTSPPTKNQAAGANVGNARPTVQSPNFDLPAAGDDLVRGFAASKNQKNLVYP